MQKSLSAVKQQLRLLKPTLCKRFNVETIEIFGSFARDEATEGSDVDLLVTYATNSYDHSTVFALRNYLRRKLGVNVDVVSKQYLNPNIRENVLKEAIPV